MSSKLELDWRNSGKTKPFCCCYCFVAVVVAAVVVAVVVVAKANCDRSQVPSPPSLGSSMRKKKLKAMQFFALAHAIARTFCPTRLHHPGK